MFNNPFTYEVASQLFSYDAESGEIRWKQPQGKKMKPGQVGGWINERGRVVVRFERKGIFGHRLAWLLHFGKWPELHLDHINGNPAEHHIPLREANDYCVGSAEWDTFNAAYREREAQMHIERVLEVA